MKVLASCEFSGAERIRLVCADDCEPCLACGEPFCVDCQQHYADCDCVGPGNAEELGYTVVEDDGKLYGVRSAPVVDTESGEP